MNEIELQRVDLNLLADLRVLLDEANLTRAAKRLGRTPSALSHTLARAREVFADPLLVRAGHGLVRTSRADALRPELVALGDAVRAVLTPPGAVDPATIARELRFSASDYAMATLINPFLAVALCEAPLLDLRIVAPTGEPARGLADGRLDFAILMPLPDDPNLTARALYRDPFVVVARADHPRLVDGLDLDRFVELPHAMVAPVGAPGSGVDRLLAARGLRRRVAVTMPHFGFALELVAASDLLLTLPASLVPRLPGADRVRAWPLPDAVALPPVVTYLVWHERTARDPAHRWVRERLAALAGTLGAGEP